jgi:hypothetical protein
MLPFKEIKYISSVLYFRRIITQTMTKDLIKAGLTIVARSIKPIIDSVDDNAFLNLKAMLLS